MNTTKDRVLLADIFSIPAKRRRGLAHGTIIHRGRKFNFEQITSHRWDGYYDDDHGMSFEAPTKRQLLEEA